MPHAPSIGRFADAPPEISAAYRQALRAWGGEAPVAPTAHCIISSARAAAPDPLSLVLEQDHADCVVIAENGARATVSVRLASLFRAGTMHIVLGEGSAVELVCVEDAPIDATIECRQRAWLGKDSKLTVRNVTLGGASVSQDLLSLLGGEGAASTVEWVFAANDGQSFQLRARNQFDARNGGGEITMKGIARAGGQADIRGMIGIGPGGGGTSTYLTQNVLLLDPTAKADAVPGLEIKTNDVKASHSATVSRITAEDLFTFASRGIGESEARAMLIAGFLGDLVERIGDEAVRNAVLEQLR